MMRIDIITVLPQMVQPFIGESILARAQKNGLVEIHIHNLRDYTNDKWRRVDDYPYGGFPGMVMQIEPIDRCISALKAERDYDEVIFTSPDGEQFTQHTANSLSGGELPAAIITDAIVRLIPGAIGDEQSAFSDCFQDDILSAPVYSRPAEYKGWRVPDILLSGHEAKIKEWEMEQAMQRTRLLRPDLLQRKSEKQKQY